MVLVWRTIFKIAIVILSPLHMELLHVSSIEDKPNFFKL